MRRLNVAVGVVWAATALVSVPTVAESDHRPVAPCGHTVQRSWWRQGIAHVVDEKLAFVLWMQLRFGEAWLDQLSDQVIEMYWAWFVAASGGGS